MEKRNTETKCLTVLRVGSAIPRFEYKLAPARNILVFSLTLAFMVGAVLTYLGGSAQATAGINQQINFQGRLLNAQGATVPDGNYNIQFKIYQEGRAR